MQNLFKIDYAALINQVIYLLLLFFIDYNTFTVFMTFDRFLFDNKFLCLYTKVLRNLRDLNYRVVMLYLNIWNAILQFRTLHMYILQWN